MGGAEEACGVWIERGNETGVWEAARLAQGGLTVVGRIHIRRPLGFLGTQQPCTATSNKNGGPKAAVHFPYH
jgi:hypothetical protein